MATSPRKIAREAEKEIQKARLSGSFTAKIGDIYEGQHQLIRLASKQMATPTDNFQLSKIVHSAMHELKPFNEAREKLLQVLAIPPAPPVMATPENPNPAPTPQSWVFETPEKETEFGVEFEKLGDQEVTLKCKKMEISQLGDAVPVAAELIFLQWLIEDECSETLQ